MKLRVLIAGIVIVLLTACSASGENAAGGEGGETGASQPDEPTELLVMTHDSFALSESVIQVFEKTYNTGVTLLPAGDAGAALNQAILAKDDPLADVFFGVDNSFIGRALEAGIFESYQSPMLADIGKQYITDNSYRLLPVDYGDVCLNYDREWFVEQSVTPPASLEDLVDPAYRSLLVVQNPATSSPGLAFMLTTIEFFGEQGDYNYLDYWRDLRANDVLVTDGWEDAYFGYFSAAGDGDRPIVVSYASSPPAEVVFADPPRDEPPTATVTSSGSCYRQIEYIGILAGTDQRALAEAFVDYALDVQFQEDIPLNMFVFPVNERASLPVVFQKWAEVAVDPATVDSDVLDQNREQWIREWTDVVLR